MSLKRYKYVGQVDSGATLVMDGGEKLDVMLFRGHEVDLPEGHEYTKRLLAQNALEEPEKEPVQAPDEQKKPARAAKPVAVTEPDQAKGAE